MGSALSHRHVRDGARVRQGDWTFGIEREQKGVRALRSLHSDGWFDLYGFTLEERFPVDYEVMNHYISTHPRSPFTSTMVVQQTEEGVRRSLVGARLSIARPAGSISEQHVLPGQLPAALLRDVGIELSQADAEELRRALAETA